MIEIQIQEQGVLVQWVLSRYGGKNTAKIQDYIKHQLEEDKMESSYRFPTWAARLWTVSNEVDANVRSCAPVRARLVREPYGA